MRLHQERRRFLGTSAAVLLASYFASACDDDQEVARTLLGTFKPDPQVLAGAQREGGLTLYSANYLETEQVVAKAFAKRFPGVKLDVTRAPTGQLVTRIKTEAAAHKLEADVIDISDRVLALGMAGVFADYAPPNAADYPATTTAAGKLWPRTSNAWTICYNPALVTNPPKSWADLTKPEFTQPAGLAQTVALAGAGPVTRIIFERKMFGRDYWVKQAALKPKLYPSGAPTADALIRGEIGVAPVVTQLAIPLAQQGAPLTWFFGPEGVPTTVFCAGMAKGCAHPNAARLFLDWSLSPEGQALMVDLGAFSALKDGPLPKGVDPKLVKPWIVDPDEYERLAKAWTDDWNHDFGYRQ